MALASRPASTPRSFAAVTKHTVSSSSGTDRQARSQPAGTSLTRKHWHTHTHTNVQWAAKCTLHYTDAPGRSY